MTWPVYVATAVSLLLIALLWRGDPKRRRVAGLKSRGDGVIRRRLLAVLALLPGLALAMTGDSAAFLVWFGSCAMGGWLVTQLRSGAVSG